MLNRNECVGVGWGGEKFVELIMMVNVSSFILILRSIVEIL